MKHIKPFKTCLPLAAFALASTAANAAITVDGSKIVAGSATGTLIAIDVPNLGTIALGSGPYNIGPDHPGTADDGFIFSSPHSNTNYNERTQVSQWEPDGTPLSAARSYSVSGGPNGAQSIATPDGTWTFDLPDGATINHIYATWTGQGNNGRRLEWGYTEGANSDTANFQQVAAGPTGDLVLRWIDSDSNPHDGDFQRLFSPGIAVEGGDGFTIRASENWNEGWLDAVVLDVTLPSTAPVPEPSTTALLGLGGLALVFRRRRS